MIHRQLSILCAITVVFLFSVKAWLIYNTYTAILPSKIDIQTAGCHASTGTICSDGRETASNNAWDFCQKSRANCERSPRIEAMRSTVYEEVLSIFGKDFFEFAYRMTTMPEPPLVELVACP